MTGGDDCQRPLSIVRSATWERVGREAVAGELTETRHQLDEELDELEAAVRGGDVNERQVRDTRMALNRARRVLEEYVATTTDETEPWGPPVPDIPYRRLRKLAHCPQEETDE